MLIIALSLLLPLVAAAVLAWWFTEMEARDQARMRLDDYQISRSAHGTLSGSARHGQ
ncbi:hypothetical protein ACFOY6_22240 [Pseudoroseomonas aestuarii]|uniref:hypothetical protein n=1 Tax=Teichococcus aestuarii TaxID=568898 RepID=UPI00361C2E3D